ncbi:hypothetical protein [Streptomyces sp. Ac-502]
MKGAVVLGAGRPGEHGPFGTRPDDEDQLDDTLQERPDDKG